MTTFSGGTGSETITGGSADDVIWGARGDDSILGGEGNDTLEGGEGDDTLLGGEGNDRLGSVQQFLSLDPGHNLLDGGAGNDTLVASSTEAETLIGGAGSDLFDSLGFGFWNVGPGWQPDTIVDFQTGVGGDVFNLAPYMQFLFPPQGSERPLGSFLRFVQSGADVLFQVDYDGPVGGNSGWTTVVVLQNINVGDIVDANLTPAINLTAAPAMIDGTGSADALTGTASIDVINGAGGNDTIDAKAGDDSIDGGDGDDVLQGGSGHDTLLGGAGNDTINDLWSGNTSIDGGTGNDLIVINASPGANWGAVSGGEGDDTIAGGSGYSHGDTLIGGAGRDHFVYQGSNGGTTDVASIVADVIVDFQAGANGDVLDLSRLIGPPDGLAPIDWFFNYHGGNPFASGHLRAVQVGADVEILIDGGLAERFAKMYRLENVNLADLTADNFTLGWFPASPSVTVTGGADNDAIAGSVGADLLQGMGGNDTIQGKVGNDQIDGGAGDDFLHGGVGNDTIDGGAGNDVIGLRSFIDEITLNVSGSTLGDDLLRGGDGNDTIYDRDGHNTLDGGAGDDSISSNEFHDLNGTDMFLPNSASTLVGGDGNDTLTGGKDSDVLTGGAGSDVFAVTLIRHEPFPFPWTQGIDRITDFEAGAGGDKIDLSPALRELYFDGIPGNDPFALGLVRLVQDGASTLLQLDVSSYRFGLHFETMAVLENVLATSLTSANFVGGFQPTVVVIGSQSMSGTSAAEALFGDIMNDTVMGQGGNDSLVGHDGNDSIEGGGGADLLDGGAGAVDRLSYVHAASGVTVNMFTNAGTGGEAAGDNYVAGSFEVIDASDHDDLLFSDNSGQFVFGYGGIDSIYGYGGADILIGGTGNDLIDGGAGADFIDGEAGADVADYRASASGVSVDLGTGRGVAGDAGGDTLNSIEVLFGSEFGDALTGQAAANSALVGGGGNDTLTGGSAVDELRGGAGDDSIAAGGGDDVAYGDDGNDTIGGGDGSDYLFGGVGNDRIDVGETATNNVGAGDDGNDTLLGGTGVDILVGGAGDDLITGNAGGDYLVGEAGNDTLRGGAGDDVQIEGGAGDDLIEGGAGTDYMSGGAGIDVFEFADGSGADAVFDFAANETLRIQANINGSGIATAADALAHVSYANGDAIIDLGGGNGVTLVAVAPGSLTAANFVVF